MSNGPEWQKKEQTRPYGTFFCGPGAGRGSLRTAVQQGNADGGCVRVRKKGLSPKRKPLNLLERETGFEPATSTLARLHSTTELLPRGVKKLIGDSRGSVNRKNGGRRIFLHHEERAACRCIHFAKGEKNGRRKARLQDTGVLRRGDDCPCGSGAFSPGEGTGSETPYSVSAGDIAQA